MRGLFEVEREDWDVMPGRPYCPYSPECVEGPFCELRDDGVLGSLSSWWCGDGCEGVPGL